MPGALYVTIRGLLLMQMWPVGNLDSVALVTILILQRNVSICDQQSLLPPGALAFSGGSTVDGTGRIVLDDLHCTGSESRLIDCPHNGLGRHNCGHNEAASVMCSGIIVNIACL